MARITRWRLGVAAGAVGLLLSAHMGHGAGVASSLFPTSSISLLGHSWGARAATRSFPLTLSSVAALASALAICTLASAAGIGGGAALVPLYLTLAGQTAHAAVALSNLTILGAAVAAFTINARRVHVDAVTRAVRPLIDWDVILLMEPATICGAVVGALLNAVTPPWLTLVGLALLLVLVTHSVAAKARGAWLAETAALGRVVPVVARNEDGGEGGGQRASLRANLLVAGGEDGVGEAGHRPPSPLAPPPPPAPLLDKRAGALLALFAVVLACDTLKTRLPCGSVAYWLATTGVVPPALALTAWARRLVLAAAADAAATTPTLLGSSGEPFPPSSSSSQLAWTPLNTLMIPAVSVLAGLAAGMFGVGGGIIKGPFLILVARLPPEVAAASAMAMILFTSATASLVYLGVGATSGAWGGAVFCVGLVGSGVGVVGLSRAIAASGGRRSLVMIAMAATLGLSLVATAWQAGVAIRRGDLGRHGSVCVG